MQRHKLKEARLKAGLTALEVAEQTGIDEMRLYSLERGRGRLRDGESDRLAAALGVPAGELLTGCRREVTQ